MRRPGGSGGSEQLFGLFERHHERCLATSARVTGRIGSKAAEAPPRHVARHCLNIGPSPSERDHAPMVPDQSQPHRVIAASS